jgi:hypothetical protein
MVADMRFAANNSRPDKGAIDSGPTLTTRLSRSDTQLRRSIVGFVV